VRFEDPNTFSYTRSGLAEGTWYIRVMAAAEGGYTDPSKVVMVHMGSTVDVDNVHMHNAPSKVIENGQLYILRNGKTYNVLGNAVD
jgi:hypothetical protein